MPLPHARNADARRRITEDETSQQKLIKKRVRAEEHKIFSAQVAQDKKKDRSGADRVAELT